MIATRLLKLRPHSPSRRHAQTTRTKLRRSGVALVEFAVVLPIVLLIFTAMIEISRVLLLQHSADTAAYEGARSAMVPGATSQEASAAAQKLLQAAGLKSAGITVTPALITEDTPLITVRVEIPIAQNAWISPKWFRGTNDVSETTLFCERPPMVQLTGVPQVSGMAKALKASKGNSGSGSSTSSIPGL